MWTMKVRQQRPLFVGHFLEINYQHPSTRFQNSSHFTGTLQARLARQMMEHDTAQHHIELSIGKWESLGQCVSKKDFNPSLFRLLLRSDKHFRGGIDSVDGTGRSDTAFGGNRKRSRTATHIQNRLAARETC